MFTCELCGKEFETERQLNGHMIQCRIKHAAQEKDQTPKIAIQSSQSPADYIDRRVSIPLSVCPHELSYLPENRQMFLRVAGRKSGDRFIVEQTKLIR